MSVLSISENVQLVNITSVQVIGASPPHSPKKRSTNLVNPLVSTVNKNIKNVTIKVDVGFPKDVNAEGVEDRNFNIIELTDFYDMFTAYNAVNVKGLYQNIKGKGYRWMFFSDEYETYEKDEIEDLAMEPVFKEKWYLGKFMTVYTLDENLKYGKYILPATKQEYEEDKLIYQRLYQIMKKNNSIIGKYVKNKKI